MPRHSGMNGKTKRGSKPAQVVSQAAEAWKPRPAHLLALNAAIENPRLAHDHIELAKEIGIGREAVRRWGYDSGFRKWWNDNLVRAHQQYRGPMMSRLREICLDSRTPTTVAVKAAQVFMEHLAGEPSDNQGQGEAIVALIRRFHVTIDRRKISINTAQGVADMDTIAGSDNSSSVMSSPGSRSPGRSPALQAPHYTTAVEQTPMSPEQAASAALEAVQDELKDLPSEEPQEQEGGGGRGSEITEKHPTGERATPADLSAETSARASRADLLIRRLLGGEL